MSRNANDRILTDLANELQHVTLHGSWPAAPSRPRYCYALPNNLWRVSRAFRRNTTHLVLGVARNVDLAAIFADAMTVNLWPWESDEAEPSGLNHNPQLLVAILDADPAVRDLANRVLSHLEKHYLDDLEMRRAARRVNKHIVADFQVASDESKRSLGISQRNLRRLYQL